MKGGTCQTVSPWLKTTLHDSTDIRSKTTYQVVVIRTVTCLEIVGFDRARLYRSLWMMAAFWTFLSGVQNDLPSFLLHSEITSCVNSTFSVWNYLSAMQMSEFSSFIRLMVNPISQSCLVWYWLEIVKIAIHPMRPFLLKLLSCCSLRRSGLGSFP